MAPRKSTGSASSSKPVTPAKTPPASSKAATPTKTPPGTVNRGAVDTKGKEGSFEAGATPIRFYDEEVERMHKQLAAREAEEARARTQRPLARHPPRKGKGVTIKGFLARVGIFYVLIAYLFVCPSDRAVCRSLDSFQSTLASYEPLVRPYYDTATKKLDPYLVKIHDKANPYLEKALPYYTKADSTLRPVYVKADATLRPLFHHLVAGYKSQAHPRLLKAIEASQEATKPWGALAKKYYAAYLAPSVEWYSRAGHEWYASNAERYVSTVSKQGKFYARYAYDYVSPLYYEGLPAASKYYHSKFLPVARSTYATSKKTYVQQVHPRLVVAGSHLHAFYKSKVLPALQRFYSLYIAPQVDKITERIFEYRTKKFRSEAVAHVEKVEEKIKAEHEVDDIDDFIAELRDEIYVKAEDAPAEPATPAPTEVVPTPEEQKVLTAQKRAALELLQTTYEKEIAKLGQVEHDLLVRRLSEIRTNAIDDIPKRFNVVIESLDEEGDKMVGRLGKYFQRVAGNDDLSIETKVADADFLSKKAVAKVRKMAEDALVEVEDYRVTLGEKEVRASEKAAAALTALVDKAQEELSYGWTWLDDVRHSDWQRFHKLAKADSVWADYYTGVVSGTIKDSSLTDDNPSASLDDVKAQIESIVDTFETILDKIKTKGQKEIKGEWTGVGNEAQKVFDAAAAAVEAVKESASSIVGATPTPTNLQESASSVASVAQESANSIAAAAYEALPTVPAIPTDYASSVASVAQESARSLAVAAQESANSLASAAYDALPTITAVPTDYLVSALADASESVAHVAAEASQTVVRAFGSEPSPTDLAQSATSIFGGVAAAVESAYGEASQSVVRAVGQEPSPTDLAQSVSSIAKAASSAIVVDAPASAASAYSAAAEQVGSIIEEASETLSTVVSAASSLAAPHPSFVPAPPSPFSPELQQMIGRGAVQAAARFEKAFGQGSQAVVKAVGGTPSPTNLAQTVASVAHVAESFVAEATSAVSSVYADVATGAAEVVGSATSVVGSLASPHPSFAKSAHLEL